MSLIFEINKLLWNLVEITKNTEKTKIKFLKTIYNSQKRSEEISNFDNILLFSQKLNLIHIENENISFLDAGKKVFSKISRNGNKVNLNPNSEQINFLKQVFFKNSLFLEEFFDIIKLFWIDESKVQPTLTYVLHSGDRFNKSLIKFLQEISIFRIIDGKIFCDNNLKEISKIKNKIKDITEDELLEKLERNKVIGKLGEELAIKSEQDRLRIEENRLDLSFDIKQISITNAYAGYDLKSYNDIKSNLTKHDRFIEVKATVNSSLRFFWSQNEINKANQLGDNYWIYLWTDVKTNNRKLHRIKNPYKKFFQENIIEPKCIGFLFEEEMIKEIITD